MKQIVITVIGVVLFSIPVVADEYPWKTLPPFEIWFIDGYQETYDAGEQIVFYVEGRSHSLIEAEPQTGFNVQASIFDSAGNKTYSGTNGKYDENKRAWLITLTAPKDNTKSYRLSVSLYCGKDESPCAEIYGRAAQTSKSLFLQIR
jgi:hypothetical protein